MPFTFSKSVSVNVIRLTGEARSYSGGVIAPPRATYVWRIQENTRHLKGDIIDIPIAHIAHDPAHPGFYGDLDLKGYYLTLGSAHVVTIEICAGRSIQTKRFLILMPNHGHPGVGARFIAVEEGDTLFPD